MPHCDSEAMTAHLAEISAAIAQDAHAVVILDQAGWNISEALNIPANITLIPLPSCALELNPVENIWQYLRENWLSNHVFEDYDDILKYCCAAWNHLIQQPWKIMSIGLRDWVNGF